MSSLDDELALFESEISSIVSSSSAAPPDPPKDVAPKTTIEAFRPRATMPSAASALLPPPVPPFAGLRPPPSIFVPPQMRPAPVIESKAQLYKIEEEKSIYSVPQEMKTQVLPADVELNELRKAQQRAQKNSYMAAVKRGEKKMKRFVRCAGGQTWEDPSLADWDPNDFRIFCGDLGNEVSDELLAKAFRKYPSFQKAKVVRDSRTNKSKGYGFVSFKSQEDFVRACREMDGKYVGNRPVKLRKSNWKDRNMEIVKKKQKQKQKLGLI